MFRWIANLFKSNNSYAARMAELETAVQAAQREAVNELYSNGKTEKFQQLLEHSNLLNAQLASALTSL